MIASTSFLLHVPNSRSKICSRAVFLVLCVRNRPPLVSMNLLIIIPSFISPDHMSEPEKPEAATKDNADDEASEDEGDGIHRRVADSIVMANRPISKIFSTDSKFRLFDLKFYILRKDQGLLSWPNDQLSEICRTHHYFSPRSNSYSMCRSISFRPPHQYLSVSQGNFPLTE